MTTAKSTVIIPAARDGPGGFCRPWWLRNHPKGQLVIHHILSSLDLQFVSRVIIVSSVKHVAEWLNNDVSTMEQLIASSGVVPKTTSVEILPLTYETSSAAATVAYAIRERNVSGSIFVKDQDGSFDHKVVPNMNYVVGLKLTEHTDIDCVPSKSFLQTTGALLSSIQEKRIVSDTICVGGYAFQSASDFLTTLSKVEEIQSKAVSNLQGAAKFATGHSDPQGPLRGQGEPQAAAGPRLFLSHLVQHQLLHEGKVYGVDFCVKFDDWKTEDGWRRFVHRFRNVEVSLEGSLFALKNPNDIVAALLSEKGTDHLVPMDDNIKYLQQLPKGRTNIVIRTSRPASSEEETKDLLRKYGVPFDSVVSGSLRAATFVVAPCGDHDVPHPSAVAYSIPDAGPSHATSLRSVLHFPPH